MLIFRDCDEVVTFGSFIHNRGTGLLRVRGDSAFCIKQNGNGPDETDALRAFICDQEDDDVGLIFDYEEYECSTDLVDVACCDNRDCPSTQICQEYSCVDCSIDLPDGIVCCTDADCNSNQTCTGGACVIGGPPPIPLCDTARFGTDCCSNEDCAADFVCSETNTCISSAFILFSVTGFDLSSETDFVDFLFADDVDDDDFFCVSYAKTGADEEVVFQRCDFDSSSNLPTPRQQWHTDTLGRIRTNVDLTRCLRVAPRADSDGVVEIRIDSCDFNHAFRDDDVVFQIRISEDESYCLAGYEESTQGQLAGKPCESAGGLALWSLDLLI